MITVGHQRMTTARMTTLATHRSTTLRIGGTHRQHMLIIVTIMSVVQMAIVQVIHVALVFDPQVPTILGMHMVVVGVNVMAHRYDPFVSDDLVTVDKAISAIVRLILSCTSPYS